MDHDLFLCTTRYAPNGFDHRLMLSNHVISLAPLSSFTARQSSLFTFSPYTFGLYSLDCSSIRGEHLSSKLCANWIFDHSFALSMSRLSTEDIFSQALQIDATHGTHHRLWNSTLVDRHAEGLGFIVDSDESPPTLASTLHLSGYGREYEILALVSGQVLHSNEPIHHITPHSHDLPTQQLGADFSNLLRANCETKHIHSHLFCHNIDPAALRTNSMTSTANNPELEETALIPIILDTGASHRLTMCEDDFLEITYGNYGSMSTAATENRFPIIGTGIVGFDAISENGKLHRWIFPANLCKAAGTRLSSPQVCSSYLNLNSRFPSFQSNHAFASIQSNTSGDNITVPIDPSTNLPIVKAQAIPASEKHSSKSLCRCQYNSWCRCPLNQATTPWQQRHPIYSQSSTTSDCLSTLFSDTNHNLSGPQRQLLLDHQRLGHIGMQRLQQLYRPHESSQIDFDTSTSTPTGTPCLQARFRTTNSCDIPKCEACLYGKAKRRPTQSTVKSPHPQAGHLPADPSSLEPGELVSVDHSESSVRGRLWTSRGQETPHHRFVGGSIFYDHKSRVISVHCQVSLGANDTITSKTSFEQLLRQSGREVKRYHTDNGIFTSAAFEQSLLGNNNTHRPVHTLSGVGAHHQNGAAERAIQTVVSMARCMLLHCHLRWPDAFCPTLWPMALEYATWIYNHVPHEDTHRAPMEILTGSRLDCTHLRRNRVWGCPAYVLDSKLQDGQKLPKWAARSRQGQFLGFSPHHSTTVGMIRHLQNNHIRPQFHVVHDELFQTVPSTWEPPNPHTSSWIDLFTRDFYLEDHDPTLDGPLPSLDPSWEPTTSITPLGSVHTPLHHRSEGENSDSNRQTNRRLTFGQGNNNNETPPPNLNHDEEVDTLLVPDNINPADESRTTREPGEPLPPSDHATPSTPLLDQGPSPQPGEPRQPFVKPSKPGTPPAASGQRPKRLSRAPRRFPDPERHVSFESPKSEWASTIRSSNTHKTPPSIHHWDSSHLNINVNPRALAMHINGIDWSLAPQDIFCHAAQLHHLFNRQANSPYGLIDDWDPRALAAKSFSNDNPSYFDLRKLSSDEQTKWREAMDIELDELEAKKTFRMIPRASVKGKEIVDTMWTLRRKRLPDGTISRYKARLVVRGDQQKTSFDRNDTFAPVIDWPSVRMLLNLSLQHGLKTTSIDFKNAFVQSDLPEPIYVNMPHGYGAGHEDQVLEISKSLYGDCRAPRLWYDFLKAKLKTLGFEPDEEDPCMFCKEGCIIVTYVDDAIICGTSQEAIDKVLARLTQMKMDYSNLGDLATYLGVQIQQYDDGSMALTQPHLTQSILAALGLESSNAKPTPATTTMGKALHEAPLVEDYNYRSVVGMLLYLGNNTRPDCAFAIHQAARFSSDPRKPHGELLKRIGRYLLGTKTKGLVLKPSKAMNLECYVDADFAGVWGNDDP